MKNKVELGLHSDIPNYEYHSMPGISKSGLDLINRSPLLYKTLRDHPRPQTPTKIFGSAFHCLILEPHKFENEYALLPKNAPKRPTKAQINAKKPSEASIFSINFWKEFDDEHKGKTIISNISGDDPFWQPGDWDRLQRMRDAILKHPIASVLLNREDGQTELSGFWVDKTQKKLCKLRVDFLNQAHNICVDLKTTDDASLTGFGKSAAKFRYHVQDAWYLDGLFECGKLASGFVFVAVEKTPPYGVACYQITPDVRAAGRCAYQRDLRRYAEAHNSGVWSSYPQEVRDLELPAWGLKMNLN